MAPAAAILFCVVLASNLAVYALWTRRERRHGLALVRQRMLGVEPKTGRRMKPRLIRGEDERHWTLTAVLLNAVGLQERVRALLERAGLRWPVARLAQSCAGCALTGLLLVPPLLPPEWRLAALALGVAAGGLPLLFVSRRASSRLRRFEEQFPDSLEFVSRAMRAGHAFSVSLEMLHREFEEPLSGEFKRAFEEQNLGMPLDQALQKLAQRVPLLDVQFFVSAVLLQKRTGGNLAEVLDKLAEIIRERFKLRGRIRAVSAPGRMTGLVLSAIPVVVGALMVSVNPDYGRFFFEHEAGRRMLLMCGGMQALGYLVIRKIVAIDVT